MEEDEKVTQQLGEKPDASEQAYAPTKEDTGNEAQVDEAATASDRTGEASELVVEQGILESEAVAKKAIPACHLVCLTGKKLKQALAGYLEVLYQADASSVGGSLPADDFYYQS